MSFKNKSQRGEIEPVGCFILVVIVAIVGLLIFSTMNIGRGYSEGVRTGTIVKFSQKGLSCKSYEGELVLSNAVVVNRSKDDSGHNAALFEFTVKDPAVAKQVEDAMTSGSRVMMHYTQWVNTSPCWGDTDYEITKVDIAP